MYLTTLKEKLGGKTDSRSEGVLTSELIAFVSEKKDTHLTTSSADKNFAWTILRTSRCTANMLQLIGRVLMLHLLSVIHFLGKITHLGLTVI